MGRTNFLKFSMDCPSDRASLDIFDHWTSKLPNHGLGHLDLFQDPRIDLFNHCLGGFIGKSVLELGALEGAHTFMMKRLGAASVTSIEANTEAFLKCLIVKNVYNLDAKFLYGDAIEYLSHCGRRFDFVLASGILYHMSEPLSLLEKIGSVTDMFGIWTHLYVKDTPNLDPEPVIKMHDGLPYVMHRRNYNKEPLQENFLGSSGEFSYWLTKKSLINFIENMGFCIIMDDFEEDGSSCTLFAMRGVNE